MSRSLCHCQECQTIIQFLRLIPIAIEVGAHPYRQRCPRYFTSNSFNEDFESLWDIPLLACCKMPHANNYVDSGFRSGNHMTFHYPGHPGHLVNQHLNLHPQDHLVNDNFSERHLKLLKHTTKQLLILVCDTRLSLYIAHLQGYLLGKPCIGLSFKNNKDSICIKCS